MGRMGWAALAAAWAFLACSGADNPAFSGPDSAADASPDRVTVDAWAGRDASIDAVAADAAPDDDAPADAQSEPDPVDAAIDTAPDSTTMTDASSDASITDSAPDSAVMRVECDLWAPYYGRNVYVGCNGQPSGVNIFFSVDGGPASCLASAPNTPGNCPAGTGCMVAVPMGTDHAYGQCR